MMTDNNDPIKCNNGTVSPNSTSQNQPNSKQQLLQLILNQGILHDTPVHPLIARDGKTRLNWVMNFLAISLNHEALKLAAQETLRLLSQFKGRQLATIGTAAVPLLSACILESAGQYSGLMVRAQRKQYGTASLIDGRINHTESVVVIDDSIGSGTNMLDCIAKLEAAGLHVEGCVCLVRFGYDSGYAALVERGYRVSYLFDQGRDISPHHPKDPYCGDYPIKKSFQQINWDEQRLPDYLSPFQVIRRSMMHYWETGRLLRPPAILNQPLNAPGGLWLSLRAQDSIYTSQGRHGFWHFPDDETGDSTILDLSRVAWLCASQLQDDPHKQQRLAQSALGLSLFGALASCKPGEFDYRHHALVVRSQEAPWKIGGALPNMPGFHSDAQLLWHARFNNTALRPYEPYHLYRHSVIKLIEPGAEWPNGGESYCVQRWDENPEIIRPIADTLFTWVQSIQQGQTLPDSADALFIPVECQWVFLSVYARGEQLACVGTVPQSMTELLALVKAAAQDPRWAMFHRQSVKISIRVALLSQSHYLGYAQDLQTFHQFAIGCNALAIQDDQQQFAIILPEVAAQYHWSANQLSDAAYQKAGIPQQDNPVHWHSYRCRSWQVSVEHQCQLLTPETPLPQLSPTHLLSYTAQQESYRAFLQNHQQPSGAINTHYKPGLHEASQSNRLFNTAYILWRLGECSAGLDNQPLSEQFIVQSLLDSEQTNEPLPSIERAYCVLALLAQTDTQGNKHRLIARQLNKLQQAFNRHGEFPKSEAQWAADYYGAELQALLNAHQAGFFVDHGLIDKAVLRLLDYGRHQATPRQYPALLQCLALLENRFTPQQNQQSQENNQDIKALIAHLTQALWHWQQSSGAFLTEHPGLSPTVFTVRALSALWVSGSSVATAFNTGLQYLRKQTLFSTQATFIQHPHYAVGGVYSGLVHNRMDTLCSAEMLWLLQRLSKQERAV